MWACLTKLWHWYTQTLKIDYTVLNLLVYTEQHMCNVVKLEIFWFSFTIIRQNYQSFYITYSYTFFSSLLLSMYWEKQEKSNWSSLFQIQHFNMSSQNPLKIKPQWWRMEGIWRFYSSNQSEFRLTKLWPTLWRRAEPTGFYDWGVIKMTEMSVIFNGLIVKSVYICKCTQNTIFNISHRSVGTKTSVSFTFSLWKWNCKLVYQLVNCIGGSRSSRCGLTLKSHHWQ